MIGTSVPAASIRHAIEASNSRSLRSTRAALVFIDLLLNIPDHCPADRTRHLPVTTVRGHSNTCVGQFNEAPVRRNRLIHSPGDPPGVFFLPCGPILVHWGTNEAAGWWLQRAIRNPTTPAKPGASCPAPFRKSEIRNDRRLCHDRQGDTT